MNKFAGLILVFLMMFTANCFSKQVELEKQTAIAFYGKVVDCSGNPVEGAAVNLGVKKAGKDKKACVETITVKSDKNGLFEITNTGSDVYVRTIEKTGYEFSDRKNKNLGFEYSDKSANSFIAQKDKPVVFYMRKKGEPAFLLCNSFILEFKSNAASEYYLDLRSGSLWKGQELAKTPEFSQMLLGGSEAESLPSDPNVLLMEKPQVDIIIKSSLFEDKKQFGLSVTTRDVNSGLIISDELCYQAPEDGYKTAENINLSIPTKCEKMQKYLYVKARGGKVYSRIDLPLTISSDGLTINAQIWTNPDGQRNLEYDRQFQIAQQKIRKDAMQFERMNDMSMDRTDRVRHQDRAKYRAARERQQEIRAKPANVNE